MATAFNLLLQAWSYEAETDYFIFWTASYCGKR